MSIGFFTVIMAKICQKKKQGLSSLHIMNVKTISSYSALLHLDMIVRNNLVLHNEKIKRDSYLNLQAQFN